MMKFMINDKVRLKHSWKIGIIEKVIYEMINSKETDNIHHYVMNIDGTSGYIVYPDEIKSLN